MKLILASTSPYRKALLERPQIPFSCHGPEVDETPRPNEAPTDLSMRLAASKAASVASRYPDAVVIGSDQVASRGGELLGKPGSISRARDQLLASSGTRVDFHTGLCVHAPEAAAQLSCEPFRVHFRELREPEIDRYLALEQPLDCAGSFKWEGLGISLFQRLEGDDPTALEGLPLIALCACLRNLGMDPLASRP